MHSSRAKVLEYSILLESQILHFYPTTGILIIFNFIFVLKWLNDFIVDGQPINVLLLAILKQTVVVLVLLYYHTSYCSTVPGTVLQC